MRLICPQCRGELRQEPDSYSCHHCRRQYPILGGIPDFRLAPDPYIDIEEDRAKGLLLLQEGKIRGFEGLLRYYYSITPEDPADLAQHWIRRALEELEIAQEVLDDYGLRQIPGVLLDVGCSTGAMLAASSAPNRLVFGVDVAFRWLAVGSIRLQELGISHCFICANAESLPFPSGSVDVLTAMDLMEHVRDPLAAFKEMHRVLRVGGTSLWSTNNRYCPIPDPQIRLWGVGLLPRRWQRPYVAYRRPDLHAYHVSMMSAGELRRLCHQAGFNLIKTGPALLRAPHLDNKVLTATLRVYNLLTRIPGVRGFLEWVGPKLAAKAVR